MGVINHPGQEGIAAQCQDSALAVNGIYGGLPNTVPEVPHTDFSAFNLGNDTIVCGQPPLLLDLPFMDDIAFLWHDESTTKSYNMQKSGKAWVTIKNSSGCIYRDTIQVDFLSLEQNLGEDLSICKGQAFQHMLKVDWNSASNILWNTGANTASIWIQDTGTYWVKVATADPPCSASDTVIISSEMCQCFTNIPNAFSPNNDGYNDYFLPVIEQGCLVKHYVFNIYNRFGQRIYHSATPQTGWNGYHNNLPADAGAYFYEVSFEGGTKGKRYYYKGDFLLIR
jgi:gliding motility-associated-like protein